MKADKIKPTIVLSTICIIVAVVLSAINIVTAPIIEAQRNASANEALLVVMPEGKDFEEIDISALGLSEAVVKAYKETSGKGYIFQMSVAGYKPGLVIMCGIDAEGKITGSKYIESNETYGLEKVLDGAYNGKALDSAELIIAAGASANSATSKAYYAAIEAALQSNVLVSGGELDPSIALKNMITTVAPSYTEMIEVEASGNFKKAFKPLNEIGFAYIMAEGEESFLAIVNASGVCKVYDVEGTEVTSAHEAIATEAMAHAAANQTEFFESFKTKLDKMMPGATEMEAVPLDTFNTVVSAISFKIEDATYYGFYTRPLTYDNSPMDIYTVIDENGAIVKQDITNILFGHGVEYLPVYGSGYGDSTSSTYTEYENGFAGQTGSSIENYGMISGATISSTAIRNAMKDVFASFDTIQKGGVN